MNGMVRVMTYNIHHGEGTREDVPEFSGGVELDRIAGVIRGTGADIVALQEVDRYAGRTGNRDQVAELAELLGMESCFGCTLVLEDGGEYGVALLSRFPIRTHSCTPLPGGNGLEPRGVLEATVELPGASRITMLITHLQVGSPGVEEQARLERGTQAEELASRIGNVTGPVVLAGDFNADPGAEELAPLAGLTDAWSCAGESGCGKTFPAHPRLPRESRIDAIFVNDAFDVLSSRVVREGDALYASDHAPVVAALKIR